MKGDFTRDTFDAARQFSRVLMQQGRVQLDADFNEQASILLHYIRTLAADLIGPAGGPQGDAFKISFTPAEGANFLIGAGRYYVDGILCENDQPGFRYRDQEGFAEEPLPEKTASYYAYLDVWERHISYVQDDRIREVALNGPDTCTRAKVVWQVKLSPSIDGTVDCTKAREFLTNLNKTTVSMRARLKPEGPYQDPCSLPPESRYRRLENQLYRIEVHRGGPAWDETVDSEGLPAGNAGSAATFKYSRENGSVVFPIVRQKGDLVTLQSLGRDQQTRLEEEKDWVEVMDDGRDLRGEPGILALVKKINPEQMTVRLAAPADRPQPPKWDDYDEDSLLHPLLRRWDQQAVEGRPMSQSAILITESTDNWIEIEGGIEVQFQLPATGGEPNRYRTGDFWLIPARVSTGRIEWPLVLENDGKPSKDPNGHDIPEWLPPRGIIHHYAPLAVIKRLAVEADGDCTCRFAPQPCLPPASAPSP